MDKVKNKPNRRSIRLKEYDYISSGWYYITVCTHNRECLFGDVIKGKMILNSFGRIVQYHWQQIPHHFKQIELDELVVMPNHIHGILVIVGRRDTGADVGAKHSISEHSISEHSIRNVKAAENASPLQIPQQSPSQLPPQPPLQSTQSNTSNRPKGTQPGSISAIVQNFSSVTTRKINRIRKTSGAKLWQRGYYDRIIRNERELYEIRIYIINNPAQWQLDSEHPNNLKI